jgi:DNA polymerase III epsilon subunit-like protein
MQETSKAKYLFFDVETTGTSPINDSLVSIGMVVTDDRHNILDKTYITSSLGVKKRFIESYIKPRGRSLKTIQKDLWPDKAYNVHGISWKDQLKAQCPLDSCREIYAFVSKFNQPLTMVYHANTPFDPRFLTRSSSF